MLTTKYALPELRAADAAAKKGDLEAYQAAFAKGEKQGDEADALSKNLRFKVCDFD